MPLDTASLGSALGDLFDDPPHDRGACAQAWADAVKGFAAKVIPASTTVSGAASTLEGALLSAFGSQAAAPALEQAFAAFAVSVAGGMAAAGFTGVPPPGPVGFAALLATIQSSRSSAAAAWAAKIDAWARTGTATLIAPPNTLLNWT
jgi:hypothetical protein